MELRTKPSHSVGDEVCSQQRLERKQELLKQLRRKFKTIKFSKLASYLVERSEEQDYISYIPTEILEDILIKLSDPKDLVNCTRASSVFRRVYESAKPEWILDEILPCLALHLDFKDILQCRQVCRPWKAAVDHLLLTELSQEDEGREEETSLFYKDRLDRSNLVSKLEAMNGRQVKFVNGNTSLQDMNQFSSEMMSELDIKENCFVGRCLTLANSNLELRDEMYWPRALSFLMTFGKLIWNLSLGLPRYPEDYITALRGCLFRVPHLRKLHLMSEPNNNDNEGGDCGSQTGRNFRRMRYWNRAFPDMHHLISLKLGNVPAQAFNVLPEAYWNNLRMLELSDVMFDKISRTNEEIITMRLQNLKELHISVTKWDTLEKLHLLTCPLLEKLRLVIETPKVTGLVGVLNHFGETLQHVNISWPANLENENASSPLCPEELVLPSLQILELTNPTGTFNFLLSLPSLYYLSVRVTHASGTGSSLFGEVAGEKIQVHDYFQRMYQSNIWSLLPNLMEIKIVNDLIPSSDDGETSESIGDCREFYYSRNWWEEGCESINQF